MKDWPHAEREFSVLTFLDDKDVDSWVTLARARKEQGKISAALKAVNQGLEVDGTNADGKALRDALQKDSDK